MELTFNDFKSRALDNSLNNWEKIGFPASYRHGVEENILFDIIQKLDLETSENLNILDIGSGCSNLVNLLIAFSSKKKHSLTLLDSKEMLNILDKKYLIEHGVCKIEGSFPDAMLTSTKIYDCILVYSVIQYPFLEGNIYSFIHKCIKHLKTGGRLLIGDIPNYMKRERFLNSEEGKKFLSNKVDLSTHVQLNHQNEERIDDSIIFSILQRFRQYGCETYLLPQSKKLPFSNRREDVLIIKR
jgi:cyclopropane fatty-acyl-phospholipid synthase-like methyltransferase